MHYVGDGFRWVCVDVSQIAQARYVPRVPPTFTVSTEVLNISSILMDEGHWRPNCMCVVPRLGMGPSQGGYNPYLCIASGDLRLNL